MKTVVNFTGIIAGFCSWLIYAYRVFRPFLGSTNCCRFTVSCSEFALLQLRTQPLLPALWAILKRVASCHPLHRHT